MITLFVLSLISFYTNFYGIFKAFLGEAPSLLLDFLSLNFETITPVIVVVFIVFALQLLIIHSAFLLVSVNGLGIKTMWLAIFLLTSVISSFFSYNYYYSQFKQGELAESDFIFQVNARLQSFQELQSHFDRLADNLQSLARHADRMSKKEQKVGGTCQKTSDKELKNR